MSPAVSMKALLESGVHFGHRTNKWNPLMRPYIFTERNGIHILDLQQTVKLLDEAFNVVRNCIADGGTILFVGTKRQAQETIQREAERCGMPYVNERWLGGILTNFRTIKQSMDRLDDLEAMERDGRVNQLSKKEKLDMEKQKAKLLKVLSGIRGMTQIPSCLVVIDTKKEEIAVKEARKLGLSIIGLVDTNADPDEVDIPIPANDDAIRSIKLFTSVVADAVVAGRARFLKDKDFLDEKAKQSAGAAAKDDRPDRGDRGGDSRRRPPRRTPEETGGDKQSER